MICVPVLLCLLSGEQANLTACLGWLNVDALDHTISDVIEA